PVRHPGPSRTLRHPTDLAKPPSRRELRSRSGPIERPRYSAAERHRPGGGVAVHFDVKPTRQGVDNRRTNTVQPACRIVGASAELAASVQLGEHNLDPRRTGPRFDVDRYATAPILYRDAAVSAQCDEDLLAIAPERLVDRV